MNKLSIKNAISEIITQAVKESIEIRQRHNDDAAAGPATPADTRSDASVAYNPTTTAASQMAESHSAIATGGWVKSLTGLSPLNYHYRNVQRPRQEALRARGFLDNLAILMDNPLIERLLAQKVWTGLMRSQPTETGEEKPLLAFIDDLAQVFTKRFVHVLDELTCSKEADAHILFFITHLTMAVLDDFIELPPDAVRQWRNPEHFKAWIDTTLSFDESSEHLGLHYGKFLWQPAKHQKLVEEKSWSLLGIVMHAPVCNEEGDLFIRQEERLNTSPKYPPQVLTDIPRGYVSARPLPPFLGEVTNVSSDFQPRTFHTLLTHFQEIVQEVMSQRTLIQTDAEAIRIQLGCSGFTPLEQSENRRLMRVFRQALMCRARDFSETTGEGNDRLKLLTDIACYGNRLFYDIYLHQVLRQNNIEIRDIHYLAKEIHWLDLLLNSVPTVSITELETARATLNRLQRLKQVCFTLYELGHPHTAIEQDREPAVLDMANQNLQNMITELSHTLTEASTAHNAARQAGIQERHDHSDPVMQALQAAITHTNQSLKFIRAMTVPVDPALQHIFLQTGGQPLMETLQKLTEKLFWAALAIEDLSLAHNVFTAFPDAIYWRSHDMSNRQHDEQYYYTALHQVAYCGHAAMFQRLFAQAQRELHTTNTSLDSVRGPDGATLLHSAAIGGNPHIVQALIEAGIPPDIVDDVHFGNRRNRTPLHVATASPVSMDRAACVKLLLEALPDERKKSAVRAMDNLRTPLSPMFILCENTQLDALSLTYILDAAGTLTEEEANTCRHRLMETWQDLLRAVSRNPHNEHTKRQLHQCAVAIGTFDKHPHVVHPPRLINTTEPFFEGYSFDDLTRKLIDIAAEQNKRRKALADCYAMLPESDLNVETEYNRARVPLFQVSKTESTREKLDKLVTDFMPWCFKKHYQRLLELSESSSATDYLTRIKNDIQLLNETHNALNAKPTAHWFKRAMTGLKELFFNEPVTIASLLGWLEDLLICYSVQFGIMYTVVPDGYTSPVTQGEDWEEYQQALALQLQAESDNIIQILRLTHRKPAYRNLQVTITQEYRLLEKLQYLLTQNDVPALLKLSVLRVRLEKFHQTMRKCVQQLYNQAIANNDDRLGQHLLECYNQNMDGDQWIDTRLARPIFSADSLSRLVLSFEMPPEDIVYDRDNTANKLGEGSFGAVYRGTYKGHTTVAVKELFLRKTQETLVKEFQHEMSVMGNLRHRNIVQLYGVITRTTPYCMIMDYMAKGSLFNVLHAGKNEAGQEKEPLPWHIRMSIAQDVARGLAYLHSQVPLTIHRDLKSHNVLLDEHYQARLADFGLSRIRSETASYSHTIGSAIGTISWMAPELFQRKAIYSASSDMYAYGMVLWELTTRAIPFSDANGNQGLIMAWVTSGRREDIAAQTPAPLPELIRRCWDAEASQRPSAPEALRLLNQPAVAAIVDVGAPPSPAAEYFIAPE